MADEKSIYERWSEERLDPPFPKEWGLDKEDEAELLWPIWPLLFMGCLLYTSPSPRDRG